MRHCVQGQGVFTSRSRVHRIVVIDIGSLRAMSVIFIWKGLAGQGSHKGTSIYCHERFKCEANGAQKLSPIRSTKQLNRGINKLRRPQ